MKRNPGGAPPPRPPERRTSKPLPVGWLGARIRAHLLFRALAWPSRRVVPAPMLAGVRFIGPPAGRTGAG